MTASGEPIAVTLRAAPSSKEGGMRSPVSVTVTNVSAAPLRLIGVVEGSQSGRRLPRWRVSVDDLEVLVETPDFTAPLSVADLRRLAPGESFDPTAGPGFGPLWALEQLAERRGSYSVSVVLDTRGDDAAHWHGSLPDHRPGAAAERARIDALLREVPRLLVRSNWLEVTID